MIERGGRTQRQKWGDNWNWNRFPRKESRNSKGGRNEEEKYHDGNRRTQLYRSKCGRPAWFHFSPLDCWANPSARLARYLCFLGLLLHPTAAVASGTRYCPTVTDSLKLWFSFRKYGRSQMGALCCGDQWLAGARISSTTHPLNVSLFGSLFFLRICFKKASWIMIPMKWWYYSYDEPYTYII